MGEAKSKADRADAPQPKPDYRGLVISAPMTIDGSILRIKSSELDEQELRFSLLFWDRLSWPTGPIHMGGDQSTAYLQQCGVLERPYYNIGGNSGEIALNSQIAAYLDGEKKSPGAWAMGQGDNSLMVRGGLGEAGKGALLELTRAVPIPSKEVPLQEILELKERRRDELLRFRFHLEALADEISNSLEPSAALEFHTKEIEKACSDLLALGKDWQFPMHISTFKTSLNLKPALVGKVLGAWETGSKLGLEFAALAATATGLFNGIKIDTDLGFRGPKIPTTPYRYAYRIYDELI